jgi:hypothetical protein
MWLSIDEKLEEFLENCILHYLDQRWPTQIGLWATFEPNYRKFCRILIKTEEKTPKHRKIDILFSFKI